MPVVRAYHPRVRRDAELAREAPSYFHPESTESERQNHVWWGLAIVVGLGLGVFLFSESGVGGLIIGLAVAAFAPFVQPPR